MSPRLLVIQHDPDDHLNELAGPLVAADIELDTWCTFIEREPPGPVDDYDAILSMGGTAGVEDHRQHPWMAREMDYIHTALDRELPYLGICFGAQILAKTAGGQMRRAPTPEIGWYDAQLTAAAADDPLLGSFPTEFAGFQFHYDTFDLPSDAELLATGGGLNQAFRIGANAWGLQFHLEVNPGTILAWQGTFGAEMDEAGVDYARMRADTTRHWLANRERCWAVAEAFADTVVTKA